MLFLQIMIWSIPFVAAKRDDGLGVTEIISKATVVLVCGFWARRHFTSDRVIITSVKRSKFLRHRLEKACSLDMPPGRTKTASLPIEVWEHVANLIAAPAHGASYLHSLGAVETLKELACVNFVFNVITTRILHRRICVTPTNLYIFADHLREVEEREGHSFLAVESLALVEFIPRWDGDGDDETDEISFILNKLSTTVKRLLLDLPLRSIYGTQLAANLQHDLSQFDQVEEFICTRDECFLAGWLNGPQWPSATNIRRAAIYNVELDDILNSHNTFTSLEILCLVNPRFSEIPPPNGLLCAGETGAPASLQELWLLDVHNYWHETEFLPFCDGGDIHPFVYETIVEAELEWRFVDVDAISEGALKRRKLVKPRLWFLDKALKGTIWDVGSHAITRDEAVTWLDTNKCSRSDVGDPRTNESSARQQMCIY
ncbi:hypothetical protein FRB96_009266 [Tulasnella sp. 330]|nr:hypothetical protein FRB96_009266 [Tulasnella sp. 330]